MLKLLIRIKRLHWLLVLSLTMALLFISPWGPYSHAGFSLKDAERSIKIKIHKLQNSIQQHKKAIEGNMAKEVNILEELEEIDTNLVEQTIKLDKIKKQVVEQERLIAAKEMEIKKVESDKLAIQKHLKKRMIAYYTTGQIGAMNVVFSPKTLPELLRFQEAFTNMAAYDKEVMSRYRESIDKLERSQKSLSLEKKVIEDFYTTAENERKNVAIAKQNKEDLLAKIRDKKTLHSQVIKEMKQANKDLTASLGTIKQKQYSFNNIFERLKGQHIPPAKGTLITLFLEETTNSLGIKSTSMGIALDTEDGSPVVSITDGIVTYAGYLRGYGNTVIINHGYGYSTITSRLEILHCEKGQKVTKGHVIGYSGDTATIIDKGLYFEVRKGKQSLDPIFWLDPNLIEVKK